MTTFRRRLRLSDRARYRICVQGKIDQAWSEAFTNMAVALESSAGPYPVTVLEGDVLDQAELIGLIDHLYGLGCSLLLVQALESQAPTFCPPESAHQERPDLDSRRHPLGAH